MSGMYSKPELSPLAEHAPSIKVETAITAKLASALNLIFICLFNLFCQTEHQLKLKLHGKLFNFFLI